MQNLFVLGINMCIFSHFTPVRVVDGHKVLQFDFGRDEVVLTGNWSGTLFDGWRIAFLYSGFSPVLMLQLIHSTGDRAVWYLGADGSRRAGAVDELDDDTKKILKHRVSAVLGPSLQAFMEDPQPVVEPAVQGFLELDQAAKADLMRLAADRLLASPGVQLITEASHAIPIMLGRNSRQVLIKRDHVVSALSLVGPVIDSDRLF